MPATLRSTHPTQLSRHSGSLRCNTAHPDPRAGYAAAEPFFRRYAEALGLAFERLEGPEPGHPTFVLSWAGSAPELPSIVLSGHMDVVPAPEPESWTHAPFSGAIAGGHVWGRGAMDPPAR